MLEVIGQIDRRHTALAQLTLDGVATFQGCVQADDGIGHGEQNASDGYGAASTRLTGPDRPITFIPIRQMAFAFSILFDEGG